MRLLRSVFSIRPLEFTFKSLGWLDRLPAKTPRPWVLHIGIHQKIGLQSAKRRLQSCGKSTYRPSQAAIPESPPSQVQSATRGAALHTTGAGIAASESQWERQTRRTM